MNVHHQNWCRMLPIVVERELAAFPQHGFIDS